MMTLVRLVVVVYLCLTMLQAFFRSEAFVFPLGGTELSQLGIMVTAAVVVKELSSGVSSMAKALNQKGERSLFVSIFSAIDRFLGG